MGTAGEAGDLHLRPVRLRRSRGRPAHRRWPRPRGNQDRALWGDWAGDRAVARSAALRASELVGGHNPQLPGTGWASGASCRGVRMDTPWGSSPRETVHASLTRWPGLPARSWTPDLQKRGGTPLMPELRKEVFEDLRHAVVVVAGDDAGGGGQDVRVSVSHRVGGAGPGEQGQVVWLVAERDDLA